MKMPPCCVPMAIIDGVPRKFCGNEGAYQNVTGTYCMEHWNCQEPQHWYVNGLRWGWDWRGPNPLI